MGTDKLILLIIALPLLGALLNGTLGKRLPETMIGLLGTTMVAVPFALAVAIFMHLNGVTIVPVLKLISMSNFNLDINLQVDSLSIWMTMIITGIGSLIHIFSIGYMHGDNGFYKFFTYLNLFIFSMLLLVLGGNYFMTFFGWEGVGICSYLLISFHYSDEQKGIQNSVAGRKAFIMNRIGDLGLLAACFLLLSKFGTLNFHEIAEGLQNMTIAKDSHFIVAVTLALFIAATGKSAQIPLFTWLPDAMAGPTPVSALIHAATMVTAGIYLTVRSNFLFELAPMTKSVILVIGLATSLVAAFIALRQNDIKKVLAYSTVSQLGLMFVALGLGAYTAALFHVTTHAFFKALLFLGSGSIIHANHHEQDITKMGGLRKYMPITHMTFLIGTLAIAGFPFLSGFYSKDEILAAAFTSNPVVYGLVVFSAALTAIYMFRLYFMVFSGEFRGSEHTKHHLHESPAVMTMPLVVLTVLSILGGALNLPGLFLTSGTHWMNEFLLSSTYGLSLIHEHHLEVGHALTIMISTSVMTLAIIAISYYLYVIKKKPAVDEKDYTSWQLVSNKKLYFDELYDALFVRPIEWLSGRFLAFFETDLLDKSVNGIGKLAEFSGGQIRKIQTGLLSNYLFLMIVGIVFFIGYYIIYFKLWN